MRHVWCLWQGAWSLWMATEGIQLHSILLQKNKVTLLSLTEFINLLEKWNKKGCWKRNTMVSMLGEQCVWSGSTSTIKYYKEPLKVQRECIMLIL